MEVPHLVQAINRVVDCFNAHPTDKDHYLKLIHLALTTVFGSESESSLAALPSNDKKLVETTLCLLLLAARHDVDIAQFTETLSTTCSNDIARSVLAQQYQSNCAKLRSLLMTVGWSPPTLLDVDWKVSHQITTDATTTGEALCTFEWKAKECGSSHPTDVTFQCTGAELQDLVWKLKEASKAVEKANK